MIDDKTLQEYIASQRLMCNFITTSLIPFQPNLGYFINVNDSLKISKDVFPEEFKQIEDAYFKVIDKLQSTKYL